MYMSAILDEELEQFEKDTEWLHSNYNELIQKHNQEYVVIKNQNVIEHDRNLDGLKQKLKERKMALSNVLIEFIRDKRNQLR
jgi:regulator of sigma D